MSKRKQRAAGHETERTTKAESSEVVRIGLLKKLFSAFRGRLWLIPVKSSLKTLKDYFGIKPIRSIKAVDLERLRSIG
jgi:hypothetical protein